MKVNVQTEDEPTAVALRLHQGGRDACDVNMKIKVNVNL